MTGGARTGAALLAGVLFGFGLALSGMVDPVRVRGFLDVAGDWDASLAFVLAGAVGVSALGQWLARRLAHPAFDTEFHLPTATAIDRRLVTGAAIFGVGWGMAGLCPGPAVAGLPLGMSASFLFVVAMLAGMIAHDRLMGRRVTTAGAAAPLHSRGRA